MVLILLVIGTIGSVAYFFFDRNRRLDKDRAQHHLASLLIAAANGRDGVGESDVIAHLRSFGLSRAQETIRLNHALKLARTAVSGDMYDRAAALARRIARPA